MNTLTPAPRALCLLLALGAGLLAQAGAQIKASERGGVHQTVDGTTITIDYSRPRARGRAQLFGAEDVVYWGHIWTPGADWATTIEVDKPVTIQGAELPAGKYSVWFVVQDTTAWEVRLEPKDSLFHTEGPEASDEQVRVMADVHQRDDFSEVLTWWFPMVNMSSTTLAMQWGHTYVPLDIKVQPTVDLTVTPEVAAPILGSYRMVAEGDRYWWNRDLVLTYDSAHAWVAASWAPREEAKPPEGEEGEAEDEEVWYSALFAVTDEWFTPGWMEDGEVWSVTKSLTLEFDIQDGRAVGYALRNRRDKVVATATRIE